MTLAAVAKAQDGLFNRIVRTRGTEVVDCCCSLAVVAVDIVWRWDVDRTEDAELSPYDEFDEFNKSLVDELIEPP